MYRPSIVRLESDIISNPQDSIHVVARVLTFPVAILHMLSLQIISLDIAIVVPYAPVGKG